MRELLSFRSSDRIILNILSFEKDLLSMKNDERIMKSIKNVAKIYHQNEAEILSPNPWNKFLFLDNFGSKTNILVYFAFDQKQLILQNDPFLR